MNSTGNPPVLAGLFSDTHLERGDVDLSEMQGKVDIVFLLGDIYVKSRGPEWAARNFGSTPVIIIDGNHEFYGSNIDSVKKHTRNEVIRVNSEYGSNIHYLDNGYIEMFGYRFIGATLWSDFNLFGKPTLSKNFASAMLNDYKRIRIKEGKTYRRLSPSDTLGWHLQSKTFIADAIQSSSLPTVVLTHHAPSAMSNNPVYAKDPLSPSFSSNMDDFILYHKPVLWAHGHTHYNVDYYIGKTRVITNQRGYKGEKEGRKFNKSMVIELPRL
tara:strand:+ start:3707 stop:4516 length:810 start_codon:yes stop_codon:yes gene_type:complete